MTHSFFTLRNAVLAAVVLAIAATPAFAQRDYRGGYHDASGVYHSSENYNGETYWKDWGVYSPFHGNVYDSAYYPGNVRYSTPYVPSYSSIPANTSYYYTPQASADDASATVRVHVPANAQIWFDGSPTQQIGEWRLYASPPLDKGKMYRYQVRARWDDNGTMKEQSKQVDVQAGTKKVSGTVSRWLRALP